MAIIKKKTRQQISKQLRDTVVKHGTEIAIGIASGIMAEIVAELGDRITKKATRATKKKVAKTKKPLAKK